MTTNRQLTDEYIASIQNAYEEAARIGVIDPNRVDIERFADMTSDDIAFLDTPALYGYQERIDSELAVANLMRGGEARETVMQKWYGRGKETL